MGILDELNKQFQMQKQPEYDYAVNRDTRPREEQWAESFAKWQEGERNLSNREVVPYQRRLNTEPEQKPQPTQQMTALTAAINKWASKGTVVKDMPARRKLMFEPQPEKNWYSGEVPTNSEILARIASISESDPAQSKELFNQYQAFANDPTSPLYNPYKTSTNKAITELQNLGFDMSGGVTDKWLQDNAWLMQYYRTETGNTPLAPTKKSSLQENAAYWYYKVLTAEETTQKAETEWQALQDEITYWTNRSDRNYSDDEILAKIDWSNYKTLTGMDDGAAKGVPTTLNRAVGYSTDALKGVIWAARNGSTGDPTMDSVNAVLGKGKGWTKNNTITQKLDPTSSKYSPYSVGSTLDEAAIYFGVQEFGKNWLDNNRALINSSDATERKMYTKVYNAEQTTQKAEAELADLQKYVNSLIREGADPTKVADAIALYVDDSCPTLAKMDESLKSGDLMGTTRAVGYKLEDIQADARKRVDAANGKVGGGQYVQNLAKKFGANIKAMATDTQVQKWRDAFVQGAYDTIQKLGTDEEKISFGNGGSADYGAFLQQLVTVLGSENPNGQEIVDDTLAGADAFVKENYLDAYGVVQQYEEAQRQYEEAMRQLDALSGFKYIGNIDIYNRIPVVNEDGSYSTVDSFSVNIDGKEVLLPTIVDGKRVSEDEAIKHYFDTGEHLGIFDTPEEADEYAQKLHEQQERYYTNPDEDGSMSDFRANHPLPGYVIASGSASDAGIGKPQKLESDSGYEEWYNQNKDTLDDMARQMSENDFSNEDIDKFLHQFYRDSTYGIGYTEPEQINAQGNSRDTSNPDVNYWRAEAENAQARMQELQAQYDEKSAILKEAQENYETAQRLAQMYGIDVSDVGTLMQDFEIAWQLGSEYVPTEWTAYTLYGQAQKDNVAHATISEAAKKNRAECMEAIAQIDSLLIRLGVNTNDDPMNVLEHEQLVPDDFANNINRYRESLEREMNAATYWLMQDAEGFEDTANQAREEINKQYNNSFIVGPDLKLMYQIANPDWEPDSVEDINTYVDQMTDDERNTYLYLWKSAGKDAAREYYDYLTDDSYGVLTTRTNQAMQNAYTKMTQSGFFAGLGMNVMDILASPMRLYGTAYTAIAGLQGKEINPNSKWFAASTMDTAVTSATTQSITDAFGEGTTLTWLAKLAYESGKSIAESMYTGHLFGGITGGGSGILSEWVGAMPMGAEAVASAVQDAKLNGATNEQALAIGGITFFAETVSEAITIGNLKEALHKGGSEGLKASFKSILKNAFTEEAPGEMFNEAIESAADYWIMGDNSKYNQEVQRLMIEEGLTKDQAEDRALVGIVGDVLYAGLSGAVGGIMGGAPEAIAGKHAYNSAVRAIQKQTGLDFDSASKILDAMETARGTQQTNEATEAQEEKPVAPTDTGKSKQETFDEGDVSEQAPQEITEEPVTPSETPAEITEEPVTEAQTETASDSTLAPVDTSRFGQVGGSNSRAANAAAALTASFGADTASRTETIGAALAPEDGQNIAPARTAAQHLAAKLGSNKAVGVMRGIVHATMDGNLNYETVQVAVTTAILNEGGQANAMLTNMAENGVTVENLTELVNEATTEAADPEVQAEMEATIRENEIAEHVKALVADGALNGLEPMKQSVTDAKNKRRAAKTALTKQVNKFNAAKQAFQEAQTAFRADPTNKDLKAAKNAKRAEMKSQSAVVDEYRQRLQNAEETVKGAEETLQNTEAQAMNNLRQQAQEQIAQEQAQAQAEAEQQAQAEAEAQAQAEQQAQQEAEAQAQEDIETGKAEEDATDAVVDQVAQNAGLDAEQTERLRERAQERLEKAKARKTDMKQAVTSADAKNILGRLSRKLGVEINVGDTGIARGKYENGVITVSDKLTIGQAVVEAALHEVTHAIEQTGAYSAYRDVVFKTLYASDEAIEAAVARKIAEYGKHGVTLDDEGARREIVADFARTKLNNKETVDRLVDSGFGATIRNALHRINQRIKNLSLSGEERTMADNLLEAERLFNKAIKERQKMETHPSAEQFSIPQLAQSMGMTFDENTLEIKDPNTGKVIKQVTPEMMTNTPIGKLIDLAEKGYTVGKMHFAPTIDAETAAQQRKMFADLMTLCTKYKDSNLVWEIASSTLSSPFSALKKNSDKQYGTTIDFSTVCTKTQAIIDVLSKTMVEKGRGLTRDEVMKAYNKTFDAGLKVPCPVCYVFARWMGVPSLLGQMSRYQDEFFIKNADGSMDVAATQANVDEYLANAMSQFSTPKELNKALGKLKGDQSKAEERRTNLLTDLEKIKRGEKTEKKPGETQKKLDALDNKMVERDKKIGELEAYNWVTQVLCNQDENGNYTVDESFVSVPKEILFDLNRTAEFAKYEKSWRYRNTRGAGMGKAILPYTGESLGDIINGAYRLAEDQNPFLLMDAESAAKAMQKAYEKARAQNLIGGQRLQSTSDFRPEWGLDYMMSFLEMQAIGSHAQMYTKVAEAVDLLASVGIDVNLSIMGKGKGWHVDENGNKALDFSDVTGMNYETARAYKDKYDNVQMILVGMNDDHIRLAIANTDIDFVIPWHSSGNSRQTLGRLLNGVGENLEASTDYSSTQNDKASKNQTAAQKERFDIRKKILTGEELTDAEFDIVQQDSAWLLPLWRRFNVEGVDPDCYGVKLSSSQASQIFPFEYWVTDPSQPGGTKDTADVNGQRFVDYCASFGMIPRFSQFKNDPGYWKLLIDRSMYDRQGNYRKQQTVDVTKAQIGNLNEQGDLVNSQLPGYIPMTMSGDADYDRRVQQAVDNTLAMIDEQYDAQGDIKITDDAQLSVDGDITDADIDQMLADAGVITPVNGIATSSQLPANSNQITTNTVNQGGERQRQFGSQTAQRSDALHDEVRDYLLKNSSYIGDTNERQINSAIRWIQEKASESDPTGYQAALNEVLSDDFNFASADGQARMLAVMQMAALQGDTANETAVADAYNKQGTHLGRALQSRNIFHLMTPLGRTAELQREVDRINQMYIERGSENRVALPAPLIQQAAEANTPEEFDRVRHEAYKVLAEQMPPTWKEKLQAWRMLSMLANPRTHIRNLLGNAVFMPAVKLKNAIATGLETTLSPEQRTKSLHASRELTDYARADANNIQDILRSEKKYNPTTEIESERDMFGTGKGIISKTFGKALQKVSDFNSWALEAEDWLFLKHHYGTALAGWMQARGMNPDTITPEQLAEGRQYAILEAQKATYRDASEVANLFSKLSRNGGAVGFVIDAALPFKKTPANILKRGIEYSPVGLLNMLATHRKRIAQYTAWQNGELDTKPKKAMSPQQYLDGLAAGLSGTAITALGALLSALGVVTVSLDDDDDKLDKLEGKQEYALNFNLFGHDVSYTIDWAAPVCMPFFVGASIYDAFTDDMSIDAGAIADSLMQITEPVFNLSMLDGVNSLLNVNSFGNGNAITQIGEKLATNYMSSFVPTALGQISRTIDTTRRKSYVESGASLSTWRYAIESIQNKTPFSVANIPYRNAWGEADVSSPLLAAFENFISPGYISEVKETELDKELRRIFEATGNTSVIPELPGKTISAGGVSVKLNDKQYDQYTVERGQALKNVLTQLINLPEWQTLDVYDQMDMVKDAYTYSNQVAKASIVPDAKVDKWVLAAQSGDPVASIAERHEDRKRDEYVSGYKAALNDAITNCDVETAATCIAALQEAGVKVANLKTALTNEWKPLYIKAIQEGDDETARIISIMLTNPDLGLGYKASTIAGWAN